MMYRVVKHNHITSSKVVALIYDIICPFELHYCYITDLDYPGLRFHIFPAIRHYSSIGYFMRLILHVIRQRLSLILEIKTGTSISSYLPRIFMNYFPGGIKLYTISTTYFNFFTTWLHTKQLPTVRKSFNYYSRK